jgi:small subunit ribosomal protein S6
MAIFPPDLADEDIATQLDRASGYITGAGGTVKEILTESPWGRRRLAYPIRFNSQDVRDGFYAVYHFDLIPSAMSDVERELKLDIRVMRYLVVHDDPKVGERNPGRADAQAEEAAPDAGGTAATASDGTTPESPAAGPVDTLASSDAREVAATVPGDTTEPAAAAAPVEESAPAPPAPQPEPVTQALAEADTAPATVAEVDMVADEATEAATTAASGETDTASTASGGETEPVAPDTEPASTDTTAPATDGTEGDAREENDA